MLRLDAWFSIKIAAAVIAAAAVAAVNMFLYSD